MPNGRLGLFHSSFVIRHSSLPSAPQRNQVMSTPIDPRRLKIIAMVLAGGQGERLYPLTRDRAKPAVPFGGIYRIVDFTLSNCINSDIRHIYALTQYKSTSLHRHIQLGWSILASPLGEFIEVIPAQQRIDDQWY